MTGSGPPNRRVGAEPDEAGSPSRRLALAFVVEGLDPSRGGVERYVFQLARDLARRGHSIQVFTQSRPVALPPLEPGVVVVPVRISSRPRWLRPLRFDAAVRRAIERAGPFDLVQGFGKATCHDVYRAGGGSHAAYLRAMRPHWPPWKRAFERLNPKHAVLRRIERRLFAPDTGPIVANCARAAAELEREFGLAPDRLHVVHNGLDLERFHPGLAHTLGPEARKAFGVAAEAFVLAFVGSGFERKGLGFALQVVARAAREVPELVLIVAGRGSQRRHAAQVVRLGLADRVHFLGTVDRVERVYAAADGLILPSFYEPFGNAPFEALACGIPTLVSRACGVSELLTHGEDAWLIDPTVSAESVASILVRWARDPELRSAMGRRARATAERHPISGHIDRVEALLSGLVARRARTVG